MRAIYLNIVFFATFCLSQSSSVPILDPPTILKSLQTNELSQVNVLVSVTQDTLGSPNVSTYQKIVDNLRHIPFSSREQRLNTVSKTLRDHANEVQKNLLNFLAQAQSSSLKNGHQLFFQQLWITNEIIVKGADLALIESLVKRPDVAKISQEIFETIVDPLTSPVEFLENKKFSKTPNFGIHGDDDEYQWGVVKINAPAVYNVTRGEGVVVASIDTGVFGTHEALIVNFRKDYGWFDPDNRTQIPYDQRGHGTHTLGTIVGTTRGIGVAPGSQWVACKAGDENGSFSSLNIKACGQWVTCPTDTQGGNEDCTKAPHLVSNSWGGSGGRHTYDDMIAVWRAAGIIPIFSIGNNGPDCNTTGYPGEHPDVIGVGSTTSADAISSFSSVGPVVADIGRIKPDIAAPGSSVYSSVITGESDYGLKSGTSMACPHVAGLVALMLGKNINLDYDQVKDLLQRGAVPMATTSGQNCGGVSEIVYPNYHVGHGRVDAYATVSMTPSER